MRLCLSFVLICCTLSGCGGGGAADITTPPDNPLPTLVISPATPSVTVGGSAQLSASAQDATGTPLPDLSTPTFTSVDQAIATIDAGGTVIGIAAGSTQITATATRGSETLTASTTLTVTAGPAAGGTTVTTQGTSFSPATLTVPVNTTVTWQFAGATHNVTFNGTAPTGGNIPDTQPGNSAARDFTGAGTYGYECTRHAGMSGQIVVTGDAAPAFTNLAITPSAPAIPVGGTVSLVAEPKDQNGSAMSGLAPATFTSSDDARATVDGNGVVTGVAPGTVTITASLTASGVTQTATATVSVTQPGSNNVTVTTPNETFNPGTVNLTPGGTVVWQISGATHNVTFTGTGPTGGNIPDTQPGNSASRTFANGGTYDYQCTRHSGMRGTVVVGSGNTASPPSPPSSAGTIVTATEDEFAPDDVTIAPGESVTWQFASGTHNVTFKDNAPPGGNIPDSPPGALVTRTFPMAGEYDYESTRDDGMKGRIRVR